MSTRRFLQWLPLTLLAAMAIWGLGRPLLDRAVAAGGQLIIRSLEHPRVTRLVVREHRAEMRRSDLRAGSSVATVDLTRVHWNTMVLLALYLALRRPFRRLQLERLGMGLAILYLTQIMNLVFHVKFFYATGFGEISAAGIGEWSAQHYSDLAREVYGFLQHFTDLPGRFGFPFLIWLGLNWDQVVEGEEGEEGAAGTPKRKPRRKRKRVKRR